MTRPPFLEVAKEALAKHYPDYSCAFVAGSMLRGEDTALSDIDIVVIFEDESHDVHRLSVTENGWPIEFFVHTVSGNEYFMAEDVKQGMCATMDMMVNGIPLPEETEFLQARRAKAQSLIDAGPPILTQEEIEDRCYFITDTVEDLDEGKPAIERFGVLSDLYNRLGDFHLRAQGVWSGHGKSLGRLLRRDTPEFAQEFEEAFSMAFQGDLSLIRALTEKVLKPYGGRCFNGYKRIFSKEKLSS